MVRNLMMIAGLTLAVSAFGCSDDAENGGGAGGAAGAPGSLDNCINGDDLAAVCDPDFQEDYVRTCATAAVGQGAGTSTCLQEDPPGLSMECADCFGGVTQCIFDNCLASGCAIDANGVDCLACREANGCDSALDNCTGDLAAGCAG